MSKIGENLKKISNKLGYLVFLKPLNSRFFVVTGGSIFSCGTNTIINSNIFYGEGYWN